MRELSMQPVTGGVRSTIRWFGWSGLVALILTVVGLLVWWNREQGRQLPLPPEARNVSSELVGGLAKKTTFVVASPVADVRAFYRDVLPRRGWAYCGTQETPGCTNLTNVGGQLAAETDVYRRAEDQNFTGTTIEVWPVQNPRGETQVTVFEANNFRGR